MNLNLLFIFFYVGNGDDPGIVPNFVWLPCCRYWDSCINVVSWIVPPYSPLDIILIIHLVLLRKSTSLYNRGQFKITSTLTSLFTSCYVFNTWSTYFSNTPLLYPPSFDGRIVLYPTEKHVRDYFTWRQADGKSWFSLSLLFIIRINNLDMLVWQTAHINNFQVLVYTTPLFGLVQQGNQTTTEAHVMLRVSRLLVIYKKTDMVIESSSFLKGNIFERIFYSRFGINYNSLDARFRKGSVLFREAVRIFRTISWVSLGTTIFYIKRSTEKKETKPNSSPHITLSPILSH